MNTFLASPWAWLSLGGVLLFLEMAAPGVFFMWLGLAALAVGLVNFAIDLSWQIDLALYALFAVALLLAVRPRYQQLNAAKSDRPHLNQRMFDYVGRSYVLGEPLRDGTGKLRIDDTLWDITGPDLPAGAKVKVTGVDGMRLEVAAA